MEDTYNKFHGCYSTSVKMLGLQKKKLLNKISTQTRVETFRLISKISVFFPVMNTEKIDAVGGDERE